MAWTLLKAPRHTGGWGLAGRTFGKDRKPYPRITVSVFEEKGGLVIGVNRKVGKDGWWYPCPLPPELCDTLVEVLHEARANLAKGLENGHLDPDDDD
jgi:hypothetical protein